MSEYYEEKKNEYIEERHVVGIKITYSSLPCFYSIV